MDAGPSNTPIVYVERLTEPYSGMPLVGVGGYLPAGWSGTVVVRYDDVIVVRLTLTTQADGRGHFATQLPTESGVEKVSVVFQSGETHTVLWSGPFHEIGFRTPSATTTQGGFVSRTIRSILTGEVLSPIRWLARFDRLRTFLLHVRQKIRYRLLARRHRPRSVHDAYIENTKLTPADLRAMTDEASSFRYRPKISILVPVYNVEPQWLDAAIQSVLAQVYDNWELCLADDASTDTALLKYYDRFPADPRIKLVRRPKNGHICAATNSAANVATGEFVALLDHDDALAPDALLEIVSLLQSQPSADVVYSDEDKIDADDHHYDPQFKPDWSPELLLSYNYVNHFTVIRRELFERVGRFRVGYEGSQDHDLLLRVTERTDRVHHIPKILYHWRALPSSTATAAGVKTYVHTSGRRAVEDALNRRGVSAGLSVPTFADERGLPVLQLEGTTAGPPVAVIVYGPATEAAATIQAVKAVTIFDRLTHYLVLDPADPADALNRIAAARSEDVLVFLRAGIRPTEPKWLSRLVTYLSLPDVAAAGGVVRGPNGEVVSAGTVLGMNDGIAPASANHGLPADAISYYFYAEVARNVSCPAAGVLATTRSAFERVGGFDADRFGRTLFDVDYCQRLAGAGLRSVHVAGAVFVTDDTSDRADDPNELLAFKHAYGRRGDPYYNSNLCDRHSFLPLSDSRLSPTGGEKLRALVAAHNLNSPEGAPRYLSEIVLGLRDRDRLDPAIWSPLGGAGEKVYHSAGVGVTVAGESWSQRFVDGQWEPREYEAAQRYLLRSLRERQAEVVVANTLLTFPVVEAATRLGIPVVWVIHESYSREHLARLFPPFARHRIEAAFTQATQVIPASHDTAELFEHLNTRGNVRVLHNGLNPEPFDRYIRRMSRSEAVTRVGGSSGKKRLIAAGTVCERKGQHTLVEAAAILARSRSDFEVDLVGVRDVIPYAGYVRQLVRRRGLDGVARLITETDDAWAYYRSADVFVCTSHMETFSRAVLEAEAFGLPIISTACCGVSEQVFWGFNALRFDTGDAAGLAEQLGRVLSDDRLRADMAKRSRSAFDNHLSEGEMLDRYDAVIRSAAGRRYSHRGESVSFRRAA